MKPLIILLILHLFISCKEKPAPAEKVDQKFPAQQKADSLAQVKRFSDSIRLLDSLRIDEELSALSRADSIKNVLFTDSILKFASRHFGDKSFRYISDRVIIHIGHLFSPKKKHAFIRINISNSDMFADHYLRIVNLDDSGFPMLLDSIVSMGGFINDTMMDVNGDRLKDYYCVTYGLNGCCRRYVHDLWLYDETQNSLHYIELMNPTFYPKEKIVRGVFYGHPGEVPLYKFKWNKFGLDTVEVIFPIEEKPGYFLKARVRERAGATTIKGLPKEYLTIKDIDWFGLYSGFRP